MNVSQKGVGRGGDAGEVYIAARKIVGTGGIVADGGAGSTGGRGGKVTIITEDNQFDGRISAQGGKSFLSIKRWYDTWWGLIIITALGTVLATGLELLLFKQ